MLQVLDARNNLVLAQVGDTREDNNRVPSPVTRIAVVVIPAAIVITWNRQKKNLNHKQHRNIVTIILKNFIFKFH